jgi:integrase
MTAAGPCCVSGPSRSTRKRRLNSDHRRKQDPIKKITTSTGEVRDRFVIDVGRRPDGGRDQRCFTFAKLTDARAARAKIIADRKAGTLIRPTKITVAELIEQWLQSRRQELKDSTLRCYTDSLELAKKRIGRIRSKISRGPRSRSW